MPKGFAGHRAGHSTRSPLELVGHLGDLMEWACQLAEGRWTWSAEAIGDWERDVARFFAGLGRLDAQLAAGAPKYAATVIFQGPVADALTHVGQLCSCAATPDRQSRPRLRPRRDRHRPRRR
jgi:hypothetical protein